MSWIKIKDLLPPTHEIILFQDRWGNHHYGVLCGDFSEIKQRNKFWCHLAQRLYAKKDVLYWAEIPINKYLIEERKNFSIKVNKFLWDVIDKIEKELLEDFKKYQEDHPEWKTENFVRIAIRNSGARIMQSLRVTTNE